MPRPSNDQILELWRDLNVSARIDEPAPPTDLVIVSFADALLDKWQYSEKDTNLDNLLTIQIGCGLTRKKGLNKK